MENRVIKSEYEDNIVVEICNDNARNRIVDCEGKDILEDDDGEIIVSGKKVGLILEEQK